MASDKVEKVLHQLDQIADDVDHDASCVADHGAGGEADSLHSSAMKLRLLVSLLRGPGRRSD